LIKVFNYYTPLSMIQYFEPSGLIPKQIKAAKAVKLRLASIKDGTAQRRKPYPHQQTKLNFKPISCLGQGTLNNLGQGNASGTEECRRPQQPMTTTKSRCQ
jgi:alpha-tubulin suppressor-like RCC1 family protein